MIFNELVKELDDNLSIIKTEKSDEILYIYCQIVCASTKCRYCGQMSSFIHSRYARTISDLPIQNYQVKLIINIPKYFCKNENCSHKTFAYPLHFVEKNAIRTNRLNDYIYQVALKNSSLDAKEQISESHVTISNNTVIRILKKKKS